ncbi:hypothetical protein V5799_024834 [Amblyomma americanum]|uniref:Uncharacterized protein n=1 Tax=Amblyomma americanum TaxID=6943 RepID=A0AAQ4EBF6_AMBAM
MRFHLYSVLDDLLLDALSLEEIEDIYALNAQEEEARQSLGCPCRRGPSKKLLGFHQWDGLTHLSAVSRATGARLGA